MTQPRTGPSVLRRSLSVLAVAVVAVAGFAAYVELLGPRYDLGPFNRLYDWYYALRMPVPGDGEPQAVEAGDDDFAELLADADPDRGEGVFRRCAACHHLDGRPAAGPPLDGVIGRPVAGVEGYGYSGALRATGGIWTPEMLGGYIADPQGFAPGTSMAFAGLRDPRDRADLVAYLMLQSGVADSMAQAAAFVKAQLGRARVAFNTPARMVYKQSAAVQLALVPQERDGVAEEGGAVPDPVDLLSDALQGETVEIAGVPYSIDMRATLLGNDFSISPTGPQPRRVVPGLHAVWAWLVTPERFGEDLPLQLELEALVQDPDGQESSVSARVLTAQIDVDVGTWDWLVFHAANVKLVHGALVAVGGTLLAVASWLWKRRRSGQKPSGGGDGAG
ncbi:cytochrome c family protein [Poseidonocella sp. HB161398]|uniref:c-type cytochrome n=1 Tax=Poseidonocella sp. HB161398 TaxID=2320855 RepID=UPI001F0DD5A8|nr:c-type cytochrome [Poseidonocella sp. HB161398]